MSFTIYPAIDLRGGKVVRLKRRPRRMTPAVMTVGRGAGWRQAKLVAVVPTAFGEKDDAIVRHLSPF
jgi:phosphoribosylformimino-5-aminoimidazole carboxamide ribonucleotide (ProFAR) isomerase